VFVLATVLFACFLPVLMWGPPTDSPDRAHHVQLVNAFFTSFQNGTVLPDWVYPENGGYGSVTVRFYPPLFHVSAALFQLVLRRMDWAIFAASTLWSLIGLLGIYLWLKDLVGGRFAPLTGAIVFALSPYHLNQFYNSFLLGEFVSLSVASFCISVYKTGMQRRWCEERCRAHIGDQRFGPEQYSASGSLFSLSRLYALTCLERGANL
jgi:4-amino-4-deoxy-L-arabinose transferase-like glycosyltransferase